MDQSVLLQIDEVTKKFGHVSAVKSVSLSVKKKEIYALIGPNGSGKTTLINCIVGLLKPDHGKIEVCNVDISKKPQTAKALMGFVPDNPQNYLYLTGLEFLRLTGRLRNLSQSETENRITELSSLFPIKEILKDRMESYSRGSLQKTAFIAALIAEPKVLIIDEPIVGLDPVSAQIFGKKLKEVASKGNAVFLSTHSLDFAGKYADKIGILDLGKLVYETSSIGDLESLYLKHTHPET